MKIYNMRDIYNMKLYDTISNQKTIIHLGIVLKFFF